MSVVGCQKEKSTEKPAPTRQDGGVRDDLAAHERVDEHATQVGHVLRPHGGQGLRQQQYRQYLLQYLSSLFWCELEGPLSSSFCEQQSPCPLFLFI